MSDICLAFFTIDTHTCTVIQHLIFKTSRSTVWQTVYDETNQAKRAIRDTRLTLLNDWDALPAARLQVFASAVRIVPDTLLCGATDAEEIMLVQWENSITPSAVVY